MNQVQACTKSYMVTDSNDNCTQQPFLSCQILKLAYSLKLSGHFPSYDGSILFHLLVAHVNCDIYWMWSPYCNGNDGLQIQFSTQ